MSQRPINLSPDLKRLRDEGYDVEIRSGHLLVRDVPYVNERREVMRGILVSDLTLAGDVATPPGTHVVHFSGGHPCNQHGQPIERIRNSSERRQLAPDVVIDHSFSSKPLSGAYSDYYEKMTTYVAILLGPAQVIDPSVKATTFPVVEAEPDESVFNYIDTASSRAEIGIVTRKLESGRIAIVGLGGSGSYVLDLVAKTPVPEIHLFDADVFSQHNAFRAPGAASIEELRRRPSKIAYLHGIYSRMRRGIIPHEAYIDASNVAELRAMSFVFLCMDSGPAKKMVVEELQQSGVPFVDVGLGVQLVDEKLLGVVRITSSSTEMHDHIAAKHRIPFFDGGINEYARNIQVADLNALSAALAVIKWKKQAGFYLDLEREHHSTYTIDGNCLTNEDRPC